MLVEIYVLRAFFLKKWPIYVKAFYKMSVKQLHILKKMISEQMQAAAQAQPQVQPQAAQSAQVAPKKPARTIVVTFDKNTERPWKAKFTERGFSVEGTRLSFEILDTAISKNFNIILNNGSGVNLDAIKMQKILKYRNQQF